jgi:hypothetical protein
LITVETVDSEFVPGFVVNGNGQWSIAGNPDGTPGGIPPFLDLNYDVRTVDMQPLIGGAVLWANDYSIENGTRLDLTLADGGSVDLDVTIIEPFGLPITNLDLPSDSVNLLPRVDSLALETSMQLSLVGDLGPQGPGVLNSYTMLHPVVIPEPGTALLLGMGLAGLVVLRRSRRQRGRMPVVAHQIRVVHSLKTRGGCLIMLALFMAGFSDAQATPIVIDTFDGADQQAPPDNEVDRPSAIGGKRYLVSEGESLGIVADGLWNSLEQDPPGGAVSAVYRGNGTLGGIDLTDGGLNSLFEIVIAARNIDNQGETLTLTVTDSSSNDGTFSVGWDELTVVGSYSIPFSSLAGGADLTSVDIITVTNAFPGFTGESRAIAIDAIRVVPEPSTGLLLGSALGVLGWARRRTSR